MIANIEGLKIQGLEFIKEIARATLALNPDPVVQVRIIRDVLMVSKTTKSLIDAKNDLRRSRWIDILEQEQRPDGSWGRFHSLNTMKRQKIGTTEWGVERAVSLGLNLEDIVIKRVIEYLHQLIKGNVRFPDPEEKNERWPIGTRLFVASILALVQPTDPILTPIWHQWIEIIKATFGSGEYSVLKEVQAHRDIHGLVVPKNNLHYLHANNKYLVTLLGSRADQLPNLLEKRFFNWLWRNKKGLGYVGVPVNVKPNLSRPPSVEAWFTSQEILSRFPSWQRAAGRTITWLWEIQKADNFWDFGERIPTSRFLPLSENWRRRRNRYIDWTTRVLLLLVRYYEEASSN
ncbi:MAG: hypothetical protein ACFFFG_08715 [Candidatus Thorarchaeota archaeon]